jgi:hypothetical protein
MTSLVTRLADLFWRRLPARGLRVSPVLGAILGDGGYLRAWPPVAAAAPPLAFAVGLLLGGGHRHETYTYSIWLLVVLGVIAGFGAALGMWAWLGYVLGDLLFYDRSKTGLFSGPGSHVYSALAITYVLLATLLVVGPLIATGFRFRLTRSLGDRPGALESGFGVHLVLQATFAYMWAQAAAFLIRPLWSYQNASPDIAGIAPVQTHSGRLAVATALAVAVRAGATLWSRRRASRRITTVVMPELRRPVPRFPPWATAPLMAIALTLLLSGLISGRRQGAVVALLFTAILLIRALVVPRIPGWIDLVDRVPLLARALGAAAISYLLAKYIVVPKAHSGSSFSPLVTTVVLSMAVTAFLLPPERTPKTPAP